MRLKPPAEDNLTNRADYRAASSVSPPTPMPPPPPHAERHTQPRDPPVRVVSNLVGAAQPQRGSKTARRRTDGQPHAAAEEAPRGVDNADDIDFVCASHLTRCGARRRGTSGRLGMYVLLTICSL